MNVSINILFIEDDISAIWHRNPNIKEKAMREIIVPLRLKNVVWNHPIVYREKEFNNNVCLN